ncbi:MAG: type II toxin-antitoxin system RelB/DinJ family antitoxin [Coriobacteriales bacterium]|nr:type II toxin-antitoxin system RelB/DinJ family antitoxin [Coriobacteriales bacterium]
MKDATVSARVEQDIKIQAEDILRQIGVPVSVVINSLYRQIIYQGGVPFQLTLPRGPRAADAMSASEMDVMLGHSYAQSVASEGTSLDEAFAELEHGLA